MQRAVAREVRRHEQVFEEDLRRVRLIVVDSPIEPGALAVRQLTPGRGLASADEGECHERAAPACVDYGGGRAGHSLAGRQSYEAAMRSPTASGAEVSK